MNFVEMIASSLIFLLVGGLYCSCLATGFGALMIVGRLIFAVGYTSSGPKGRLLGAILNDLAIFSLFIMSMIYCVNAVMANCSHSAVPTSAEM